MTLSAEDKEKLKQNRLENLRRGREKAKAAKDSVPSPVPQVTDAVDKLLHSVTGEPAVKPPVEAKLEAKAIQSLKTRRMPFALWKILLGGVGIVLGILILVLGNTSTNALLIAIGAAGVAGGGWLLFSAFQGTSGPQLPTTKRKGAVANANCVMISAERIDFVNEPDTDKLFGIPAQCINDGKYYYLHFKGLDGNGSIEPVTLPDPDPEEQYYDPKEALNCLRMPLSKRYFNYMPSQTGVVSVVIMGIILGAELITLIAMGG